MVLRRDEDVGADPLAVALAPGAAHAVGAIGRQVLLRAEALDGDADAGAGRVAFLLAALFGRQSC